MTTDPNVNPLPINPLLLDSFALRRRVLLTAVLTMSLYLGSAYVLTAANLPSWMMIGVLVLVWLLVVRPLMQPVRDSVRLRRNLAYQSFREQREDERG